MRFLPAVLALALLLPLKAAAQHYDLLVYGATPAGIAAAVTAAREGDRVVLVEPGQRIGGMLTNGLSHTDFRTFESLTGIFREFMGRVVEHYRAEFGPEAEKVCFQGAHAEPGVNLAVLEKMLAEQGSRITLLRGLALEAIAASSEADGDSAGPMRALEMCNFADPSGQRHTLVARCFIDATYEGDLMAACGVKYRVGREGRAEWGEPLAPEQEDAALQAYNYRLCLTQNPENRRPPAPPSEYERDDYERILPLFASGVLSGVFSMQPTAVMKAQLPPLPHGKYDVNDMSHGPVRLSMPDRNDNWPDGGGGVAIRDGFTSGIDAPPFSRVGLRNARAKIADEHLRWQLGLLYFLQTDAEVPAKIREEAAQWGLCKDEFTENAGLPEQIYVREARRMIGRYIFTEKDVANAADDARAILHKDAIAIGDYGPNCHGVGHEGSRFGGKHTGEFYKISPPYQIPYGAIIPVEYENLLVPCALSSSHVGFCALRYEPIWMQLGQAAGHAAHLMRVKNTILQRLSASELQALLHKEGSATIYFSDLPPDSADFAAAQWWGALGGFHGVEGRPAPDAVRGENIVGQYFKAFTGHAAQLETALDPKLEERWRELAAERGLKPEEFPPAASAKTRGEWVRAAFAARSEPSLRK